MLASNRENFFLLTTTLSFGVRRDAIKTNTKIQTLFSTPTLAACGLGNLPAQFLVEYENAVLHPWSLCDP